MSKYPGEWIRPEPTYDKTNRQSSSSSHFSHGSFQKAEIGEAVPVPIKRSSSVRTQGSVVLYEGGKPESAANTDVESMFSESQVQIGRLDTRSTKVPRGEAPSMTVRTDVEDVVPPRSKRRPVSEILPKSASPKHAHRASITDDLDRLMENAHSLRSEPMYDDEETTSPLITPSAMQFPRGGQSSGEAAAEAYEAKRRSTVSSQSFETADSGEGWDYSPPVPPHTVEVPVSRVLPKRPTPQNMEKARVASQQFSMYSEKEGDRTLSLHEAEGVEGGSVSNKGLEPEATKDTEKPEYNTAADYYFKAYEREFAAEQGFTPDTATTSEAATSVVMSRNTSVRGPAIAKGTDSELQAEGESIEVKEPTVESSDATSAGNADTTVVMRKVTPLPIEQPTSEDQDEGENQAPNESFPEETEPHAREGGSYLEHPQANTLLAKSDPNIATRDSTYMDHGNQDLGADDDEYYDIDEPMVVPNPVRAKSVKDNIQMPKRKSTKRKTRKSVRSGSSGSHLKPFSYNTLVHLLESINGAVIGEEFETLNIPIKEKQMIEKIVDSLSRLTSDMLLDEQRCEVGFERLEKAHRALEGFL